MTTMMEIAQPDPATHGGVSQFAQSALAYNIKRAGGRPLRFEGSELAMAMSYTSAIPYWYEINIYRTVEQRIVTAVRLFHQSEERQDTVQAWESANLEEAIDSLTSYDAANDVRVAADLDIANLPAAEAATIALQLLAQITDARYHFQSLVGEFLYDLENGR